MIVPSAQEVARRRKAGAELARSGQEGGAFFVLSTFNLDLLPPLLLEALDRAAVPATEAQTGPFGQLSQQILDPSSALYATAPAGVLLVPAAEDLLAPLFSEPGDFAAEEAAELVEARLAELSQLVDLVLDRLPAATCYVTVFTTDRAPRGHVLDPAATERRQHPIELFADGVRRLSRSSRVVAVDWDWHVRSCGWDAVRDDRLWYLGRMRLSPAGLVVLADLVALHVAAYHGVAKKVLALDLDGTLWGGVVAEAGLGGIHVGEEGVGFAYQDFQRALLLLKGSGVLLAVCSKNNPEDAHEAFDRHPGMLLRRDDLAAERINWQDKATNLSELARELDLGLDSFVFLDDNPVEREWVRRACPEVLVPELPEDPTERPAMLRRAPWFARIAVTEADRTRSQSYMAQRDRKHLEAAAVTFDDFLVSLDQEVLITAVDEATLARAAQLCQRTNQFNLTTKRYTPAELESLRDDDAYELFTLAVRDRFGDSGITGIAILRHDATSTTIDTLLLSCRILGRRVEDAFLGFLAARAASRGSKELIGLYEPTAKNALVRSFYEDRGFERDGKGSFRKVLDDELPEVPAAISLTVTVDA